MVIVVNARLGAKVNDKRTEPRKKNSLKVIKPKPLLIKN
jgi:hypothetical protein